MATGRRPPPGRARRRAVCGGGGKGTLRGRPSADPAPGPRARAPRPLTRSGRRAAPPRASPRGPPGSAAPARALRGCPSGRNLRRRRSHGPGAEARRHFRPRRIPPRDGDVTALTARSTRAVALGPPPPRGARGAGRVGAGARGDPEGGAPLRGAAGDPQLLCSRARDARDGGRGCTSAAGSAPEVLKGCGGVPRVRGPSRALRPASPLRGLGAAARDVQTQLSAGARDSRIAFGQSGAAARGGEGGVPEAPGRETPRGNGDGRWGGSPRGTRGTREWTSGVGKWSERLQDSE